MIALRRKVWRDVRHMSGQMTAIIVVMICGVALFVTLRSMHGFLNNTMETYYREYRFGEVFANATRAPNSLVDAILEISGVVAAQPRVVRDVVIDVPGLDEPATGRLVSIPELERPVVNDLYLRGGRYIERDARDEVLISEAFALANELAPGDSLGAVINGRWQVLKVVGVALSPEFVYEIRGIGDVFPDNRRFGVIWMGRRALASTFQMEGAFNEVSLTLDGDASEREVISRLDELLGPYGGVGAYGRDDHVSHRFLEDEVKETQVTSILIPGIFLGVTAFLLNMVMSRLIASQREQIAILKAFGYSNRSVARHFLEMAAIPIGIGGVLGTALGLWLAGVLAVMYAKFFQFPAADFNPDLGIVVLAVVVTGGATLLGALGAVWKAVSLPPAEAMRPAGPEEYRPGPVERFGLERFVSPAARMIFRNMERRPFKTVFSALGIALATSILVTGLFMYDAVDVMKEVQFHQVQREDVMVTFFQQRSHAVVHELEHLPSVRRTEPFRAVPVRLRSEWRTRRSAVLGLTENSELRRIVDEHGVRHRLPPGGVVMTTILARELGVSPGDSLTLEVLEGSRPVREVFLAGVVDEVVGNSVYMRYEALNDLMYEGGSVTGAFLQVERTEIDRLYERLKGLPAVSGVSVRESMLEGFENTIAESFYISLTVILVFACVLAFGIVYNGARISLSERGRELASLRVLGFSRREVSKILLGEQVLLTALGIPFGIAIGLGLAALVSIRLQTLMFRIPLAISGRTLAVSILVVAVAAALSALVVRRRIDHLDLISVLKTRE